MSSSEEMAGGATRWQRQRQQRQQRQQPNDSEEAMAGGRMQGQEVVQRIAEMFRPQFKDIQEKLDDLVTRREHDKDIAEIHADIKNVFIEVDKLRAWQDERPRHTVDVERVVRIEQDVTRLQSRPMQNEQQWNRWLSLAIGSGIGCLAILIPTVLTLAAGAAGLIVYFAQHLS